MIQGEARPLSGQIQPSMKMLQWGLLGPWEEYLLWGLRNHFVEDEREVRERAFPGGRTACAAAQS